MDRRTARKEAFCLAFEYGFDSARPADELLSLAAEARDLEADEYVSELLRLLTERSERIDDAIRPWLKGWKLERISRVARAVLRVAVCEILVMPAIPDSVSINEAVELAKEYGDEQDAGFVNGVLGSLVRAGAREAAAPAEAGGAQAASDESAQNAPGTDGAQ